MYSSSSATAPLSRNGLSSRSTEQHGGQPSDLHFRRLLDKLPAGAYLCDADGLITYYNQSAVELWGRAPLLNDTVDRYCGSFRLMKVDGTPIEHDQCWMALALKNDREYNGEEIMIERPDGSRLIGLAHANPIHDDSGRMIGAVNVLVDITERKHAEDALRKADQAKDEFLAMLSHELRNPLAPMRNALAILRQKGTGEPEGRRALEVIDRQLAQMTHLVDDLLDLRRITDGELVLRESDFMLDAVIAAAVETSRPHIDGRGHELVVQLWPESIRIRGDAHRLTQALANVLNNAALYTPRGGRIELTLARHTEAADITVRDNGVGIPRDQLESVFAMFGKIENGSSGNREGLGVGLALSRRVIELHGGTITVQSEGPGRGSAFSIHLPLPAAEASSAVHSPLAVELNGTNSFDPGKRVLVVDDNPDVIESMSMLLEIMNIDVRTASNGAEAIDIGESYRPDVILMDIGMPGMNGLDCARMMRQKDWGKSASLVAVTGWGQDADVQRSREAGFDSHLVKPMDPDALMSLLQ